jgi:hypothetical protein
MKGNHIPMSLHRTNSMEQNRSWEADSHSASPSQSHITIDGHSVVGLGFESHEQIWLWLYSDPWADSTLTVLRPMSRFDSYCIETHEQVLLWLYWPTSRFDLTVLRPRSRFDPDCTQTDEQIWPWLCSDPWANLTLTVLRPMSIWPWLYSDPRADLTLTIQTHEHIWPWLCIQTHEHIWPWLYSDPWAHFTLTVYPDPRADLTMTVLRPMSTFDPDCTQTITASVVMARPLWREDGSVSCHCLAKSICNIHNSSDMKL